MATVENVKQLSNVIKEINHKYDRIFRAAGNDVNILTYIEISKTSPIAIDIIKQLPSKELYEDLVKSFIIRKSLR